MFIFKTKYESNKIWQYITASPGYYCCELRRFVEARDRGDESRRVIRVKMRRTNLSRRDETSPEFYILISLKLHLINQYVPSYIHLVVCVELQASFDTSRIGSCRATRSFDHSSSDINKSYRQPTKVGVVIELLTPSREIGVQILACACNQLGKKNYRPLYLLPNFHQIYNIK